MEKIILANLVSETDNTFEIYRYNSSGFDPTSVRNLRPSIALLSSSILEEDLYKISNDLSRMGLIGKKKISFDGKLWVILYDEDTEVPDVPFPGSEGSDASYIAKNRKRGLWVQKMPPSSEVYPNKFSKTTHNSHNQTIETFTRALGDYGLCYRDVKDGECKYTTLNNVPFTVPSGYVHRGWSKEGAIVFLNMFPPTEAIIRITGSEYGDHVYDHPQCREKCSRLC